MTVETEVANLTTAVDGLTSAVNVSKATLDASVADAESAQTGAQSARDTTLGYKNSAEAAATSATNTASALTGFDLSAINDTITDTAVDVFVYDTSKDSDGGAWRKRTQGTSWYNETLNTSTRGNRKEFPAVAVIVAEVNTVTIYDGDDPALPMWATLQFSSVMNSVVALNGTINVGSDSVGTVLWSFIDESLIRYISAGKQSQPWSRNVSGSNFTTIEASAAIVSNSVNDVAMTVLPNAPVNPATGLPVVTVAVATNGGVSVIKDDGTVVDITWSAEGVVGRIAFIGDKIRIGGSSASTAQYAARMYEIPSSDISLGAMYVNDATAVNVYLASSMHGTNIFTADMFYNGTTSNKSFYVKDAIASSTKGLTHLSENYEDATNAMMAYTTSSYNTGWMQGDIKGAWLSDTDDTDLVGGNLIPNGDFSSTDLSAWTIDTNSTAQVVAGQLELTATNAFDGMTRDTVQENGAWYLVSIDLISGTGRVGLSVSESSENSAGEPFYNVSKTGPHTFIGYAQARVSDGRLSLRLRTQGAGATTVWDNLSFIRADANRSVEKKGLTVNGTITKTPVATGADLVGYSGFSGSNYLEQPYNSDLDFGTGDFCVMGWVKFDQSSSYGALLHRSSSDNVNSVNTPIAIYSGGTGITVRVKSVETIYAPKSVNIWTQYAVVRASGVLKIYVNGVEVSSTACTDDMSDSAAVSYIGGYYFNGAINGEGLNLALLRVSATAPSVEQIAKIYNDEKHLFQENAQATLHGTSDAVTALAYDDTTELLHVGTSQGRSVFQGLRRVENTTDAVGAAISASNNLVVEE